MQYNRKVSCCAITTISINSNIKPSHQQFQSELLDNFDRFVLVTGFFDAKIREIVGCFILKCVLKRKPKSIYVNNLKIQKKLVKSHSKGQLISKCLFEKIVWTKIPTKNLIDSAHYTCWAESIKFFVDILVQTIFSKRHSEINWPLVLAIACVCASMSRQRSLYMLDYATIRIPPPQFIRTSSVPKSFTQMQWQEWQGLGWVGDS